VATNSEASAERLKRRRSNRQGEILRAAGRELLNTGYSGASLDNIAEGVFVGKATLYHYFPTKEALYQAWLEMVHKGAMGRIVPAFEGEGKPIDRLHAMVVAEVLVFATDFPDYARVFLRGMDWPDDLGAVIHQHREELEYLFRQVITEGTEQGELDVPNATVARHCVQGCLAYIPEWFHPHGSMTANEVGDAVATMLLRMVGAHRPGEPSPQAPPVA
jgi:AcrR family transcriptional regulator